MQHEPVIIREYDPADLEAVYRVCLLTADNGGDGTALFRDPDLPGNVYAGPYAVFEPSLAFVAEDSEGVGGYIVAAFDSLAFRHRLEQEWWPELRLRYPEPPPDVAGRLSLQERQAIGNIHRHFGAPDAITRRFPAHLHINLVPRLQGQGAGRRLVAALTARLREQGSPGLHLLVAPGNERAIGFYRHLGFTEEPVPDLRVFTMRFGGPAAAETDN
ncbi:MAG TPA: GNAT family N-acetyltransferase [Streptosporangiaceae bacterium]